MDENNKPAPQPCPNAVDDIRKIREKLSNRFDNDAGKLAEYARQAANKLQDELQLKQPSTKPVNARSE
jgi:hypothetical protein